MDQRVLEQAQQGGGIGSLDPHYASQFTIARSELEFSIAFGRTRMLFDQSGQIIPQPMIQWLFSVAISPIAFKDLVKTMQHVLTDYELQVGTVPDINPLPPGRD